MMSCRGDDVGGVGDGKVVSWVRLMPRMALRVLLVEADESTRQVIATLLRKCGYKVAAVSDGLTAWEVLKGRPNGIDLILTEVDLPSISGFALLTLITEHDSCKDIPVIMMSKNDSVNMVYKCMLRGAADFLVKPVRKNELQNLWQHVWRRQAATNSGQGGQDESITQRKVEGQSDNDLLINELNIECTPDDEECNEKGNDAQSSCSGPSREAESTFENTQDNSKSKFKKLVTLNIDSERNRLPMKHQEDCNRFYKASDNHDALNYGSREAIDLIGTFKSHSTRSCVKSGVSNGSNENDSTRLDLSLRSYDDSRTHQDIIADERRNVVYQSNASAFSRYQAKKPSTRPRDCEDSSNELTSTPVPPGNLQLNSPHLNTHMSSVHQYHQVMHVPGPNISGCSNLMTQRQDPKTDMLGQVKNISFVNERSQSSNLCNNGLVSRLNSFGSGSYCGSNGCSNPTPEGISTRDENTNRSLQREAALNKFRLKRKDRCFEKKVRYESRKKLAETRPRVKGQFVRQAPADPQSPQLVLKI